MSDTQVLSVRVEHKLVYRPFDYRTMEYVGAPKVVEKYPEQHIAEGRLELNRSVSGAPEEWWIERVTTTTERLEL